MKYTIVILLTRALLKEKKMLSLLNSITRDADFKEIFTGLKNQVCENDQQPILDRNNVHP
jgi:hypothetical protein